MGGFSMSDSAFCVCDDTYADLRALVAEVLGVKIQAVTPDADLVEDLGADVFALIELMLAIEDRFVGVEITDDDIEQTKVVGDLLWCIEADVRNLAIHRTGAGTFAGNRSLQVR
jgi:acyl carrier protein